MNNTNEVKMTDAERMEMESLRQQLVDSKLETRSIRTLLNCYNVGGWTDAESAIRRALDAEQKLSDSQELAAELAGKIDWYADYANGKDFEVLREMARANEAEQRITELEAKLAALTTPREGDAVMTAIERLRAQLAESEVRGQGLHDAHNKIMSAVLEKDKKLRETEATLLELLKELNRE
jgi:hypothetical protein